MVLDFTVLYRSVVQNCVNFARFVRGRTILILGYGNGYVSSCVVDQRGVKKECVHHSLCITVSTIFNKNKTSSSLILLY